MPPTIQIATILDRLNQFSELLESNDNLIERQEIHDFVSYWQTILSTATAVSLGWVTLTKSGKEEIKECYLSLEKMCPSGVEYFLENSLDCNLNSFRK